MATLSLLRTASQTFTLASYMAVSFLLTWHLLLNYLPTALKQSGEPKDQRKAYQKGPCGPTLWAPNRTIPAPSDRNYHLLL